MDDSTKDKVNQRVEDSIDLDLFRIKELEERLEMAQLSAMSAGPNSVCWLGDAGCGGGGG